MPKPPKVSQKSHPDGQQKEDREFIKTSSLFKNNPEIPEMQRWVYQSQYQAVTGAACRLFADLMIISVWKGTGDAGKDG